MKRPSWIDFHPDPRPPRHRVRRTASEAWLWTRVAVTLVAWTATAAIVGLVVALGIPGLR